MQSPHITQRSLNSPGASTTPMKVVLRPGITVLPGNFSPVNCTPAPHARERTASASWMSAAAFSKYSCSHCRSIPPSLISISTPSLLAFMRRSDPRISASLLPPSWQTATQVLQPKTRTFLYPLIMSQICSSGFCLPTIMPHYSFSARLRSANQIGEGPSCLIFSVNFVQISAHFGPSAAERLNISMRSGLIPTLGTRPLRYWILFLAFVFPSRK